MKLNSLYCVTAISLAIVCVYFSQVKADYPVHRSRGFYPIRGLNTLGGYSGHRNGYLNYLPVPVVKQVTHHHIHHIVPHKELKNNKYVGGEVDRYNEAHKSVGSYGGLDKDHNDFGGSLAEEANYRKFYKRGGRYQGENAEPIGYGGNGKEVGDYRVNGNEGGAGGGIQGLIGDTKAEFVPVVIGILDDGVKDNVQKGNGDYAEGLGNVYKGDGSYAQDFGKVGGFYGNAGHGFGDGRYGGPVVGYGDGRYGGPVVGYGDGRYGGPVVGYGAENKEYSSRKGFLRPSNSRPEYIPPKETVKLFEELAKLGW